MNLRISDCSDKNFIEYVISYVSNYIISNIDFSKLSAIQEYMGSLPQYNVKFRNKITCREIIYGGVQNLKYERYGNEYSIFINRNVKLEGTDIKLVDACMLINYGSLSVKGYPIFTEAFNDASNKIDYLYRIYKGENSV